MPRASTARSARVHVAKQKAQKDAGRPSRRPNGCVQNLAPHIFSTPQPLGSPSAGPLVTPAMTCRPFFPGLSCVLLIG